MKRKIHLFCVLPLLVLMLLFTACNNGPIETITFNSPDGDRSVTVSGERESAAGPIKVKVELTVEQGSSGFTFEHQGGSLTNDNVRATWENNSHAILTFKLDDGEFWQVDCFLMEDKLAAVKRLKVDDALYY